MSNDTVFYEDYLGKVHLTPGMGHGDPFGFIREAFERHNLVASLVSVIGLIFLLLLVLLVSRNPRRHVLLTWASFVMVMTQCITIITE